MFAEQTERERLFAAAAELQSCAQWRQEIAMQAHGGSRSSGPGRRLLEGGDIDVVVAGHAVASQQRCIVRRPLRATTVSGWPPQHRYIAQSEQTSQNSCKVGRVPMWMHTMAAACSQQQQQQWQEAMSLRCPLPAHLRRVAELFERRPDSLCRGEKRQSRLQLWH